MVWRENPDPNKPPFIDGAEEMEGYSVRGDQLFDDKDKLVGQKTEESDWNKYKQ